MMAPEEAEGKGNQVGKEIPADFKLNGSSAVEDLRSCEILEGCLGEREKARDRNDLRDLPVEPFLESVYGEFDEEGYGSRKEGSEDEGEDALEENPLISPDIGDDELYLPTEHVLSEKHPVMHRGEWTTPPKARESARKHAVLTTRWIS